MTIDRVGGEGRQISRARPERRLHRVRINGVEAIATGGGNCSRGFDFNVFASELFNSITVRKTQSADVAEGSLGATVDLQSGRPFDYKGFQGRRLGRGQPQQHHRPHPAARGGPAELVNPDQTFGVLASVALFEAPAGGRGLQHHALAGAHDASA
ncbi:hypothetical protein ACRAWD_29585 [Caulobacter segnis]